MPRKTNSTAYLARPLKDPRNGTPRKDPFCRGSGLRVRGGNSGIIARFQLLGPLGSLGTGPEQMESLQAGDLPLETRKRQRKNIKGAELTAYVGRYTCELPTCDGLILWGILLP